MNARQLNGFRTVMQQGSVSAAARELGLTQPAVSRLIRDLEQSIGLKLFERRQGGMQPTAAALSFMQEVERYFFGMEQLERTADQLRNMRGSRLRVGAPPMLAAEALAQPVARFSRRHAEVSLELSSASQTALLQQLAGNALDMALLLPPFLPQGVRVVASYEAPVQAVVPADHVLAGERRLSADRLDREPVLLPDNSMPGLRQTLQTQLQDALIRWEEPLQSCSPEVTAALVAAGAGIGLCDPFSARLAEQKGAKLCDWTPQVSVALAFVVPDRVGSLSTEAQALIDYFAAWATPLTGLRPLDL